MSPDEAKEEAKHLSIDQHNWPESSRTSVSGQKLFHALTQHTEHRSNPMVQNSMHAFHVAQGFPTSHGIAAWNAQSLKNLGTNSNLPIPTGANGCTINSNHEIAMNGNGIGMEVQYVDYINHLQKEELRNHQFSGNFSSGYSGEQYQMHTNDSGFDATNLKTMSNADQIMDCTNGAESNALRQAPFHHDENQNLIRPTHSTPKSTSLAEFKYLQSQDRQNHFGVNRDIAVMQQVGIHGHATEQQDRCFSAMQFQRYRMNQMQHLHLFNAHNTMPKATPPSIPQPQYLKPTRTIDTLGRMPCSDNPSPLAYLVDDSSRSNGLRQTNVHKHDTIPNIDVNKCQEECLPGDNPSPLAYLVDDSSRSNGLRQSYVHKHDTIPKIDVNKCQEECLPSITQYAQGTKQTSIKLLTTSKKNSSQSKSRKRKLQRSIDDKGARSEIHGLTKLSKSNGEDHVPIAETNAINKSTDGLESADNSKIESQNIHNKQLTTDVQLRKWSELTGIYPSDKEQEQMSTNLGITKKQINVWFTNHRAQEIWSKNYANKKRRKKNGGSGKICCVAKYNINILPRPKIKYLRESFFVLREAIYWFNDAIPNKDKESICPNAPLAEIWLSKFEERGGRLPRITKWPLNGKQSLTPNHTLMGRRWLWDEGYFTDGLCRTSTDKELTDQVSDTDNQFVPLSLRAYCDCGRSHLGYNSRYRTNPYRAERGGRRNVRSGTSVKMSSVLSELANDNLNPHTLISCDQYVSGPEFRYLIDSNDEIDPPGLIERAEKSQELLEEFAHNLKLDSARIQPFDVKVSPDVAFLADLHSHISNSEVIGLLGGEYNDVEKCLYIQAAFPCKSTARTDEGFTDVEMDPVSQAITAEVISQHGMKLVGWYHSHPKFQPDPSVTDIQNQERFQTNIDHPFVGLIVGTFGPANPSSQSIMRWFHVAEKRHNSLTYSSSRNVASAGKKKTTAEVVHYPMKLQVTYRKARTYKREGTDPSKIVERKTELAKRGSHLRYEKDVAFLISALKETNKKSMYSDTPFNNFCTLVNKSGAKTIHTISDISTTNDSNSDIGKTKTRKMDSKPPLMAFYAKGEKEVMKSVGKTPSRQILALDIMYGTAGSNVIAVDHCSDAKRLDAAAIAFTREDFEILQTAHVSNDIKAAIIWHAIEREQTKSEENESKINPPTWSTILMRLYNSEVFGDEVASSMHRKTFISDDDAIIIDSVYAVFKHYTKDSNKIDPFGISNFALDPTSSLKMTTLPLHIQDYFKLKIAASANAYKMKNGHKMTSSLLASTGHMHLNYRNRPGTKSRIDTYLNNDSIVKLPDDIEFVTDIMRLLATSWKDGAAMKKASRRVQKSGKKKNGTLK